jgi:Cd2+/Zn2+-exporting ATPase
VLIKGGAHLENLGRLRVVAFDKTGTLTAGQPRLTDVRALDMSEDALLRLAAAVETHSAHPLARAVVVAARERGLDLPDASAVQAVTGHGIRAQCAGSKVQIGHAGMFGAEPMDAAVRAAVDSLEAAGRTVMLVRVDGRWAGVLGLLDTPRPGAAAALQALARLGVGRTVMLTGDHPRAAAAVAQQLGVTDVRAGLLPQDKLAAIGALVSDPGQVAMVGDGVNDAPALARATVGIAMGGAGSDAALEAADVALMGDDLGRLAFAVALGRAARRAIRQNLVIALGTVALLAPAAALGWAGIGVAVILHEGSTLLVVLNGLRLLAFADRQN